MMTSRNTVMEMSSSLVMIKTIVLPFYTYSLESVYFPLL